MQCGICLEEHPEDHIASHQEMCVVRLVFRCSHCNEDFMSKEGLWNHLDLHEIADESKEFNYQELKTRQKLHQCELCNDQRAYSESFYLKHVHEVHDGFALKCSACGEHFRNEQLRNDHVLSNCKASGHTPGCLPINVEEIISDPVRLNLLKEKQNITLKETNVELPALSENAEMSEKSPVTAKSDINDLEMKALETVDDVEKELRLASEDCEKALSEAAGYPKRRKSERMQKCPHCPRILSACTFPTHLALCENKRYQCEICQAKFRIKSFLIAHIKRIHRSNPNFNEGLKMALALAEYPKRRKGDRNQKCPHCPRLFSTYTLPSHLAECEKRPFSCDLCPAKFHIKNVLTKHMRRKHRILPTRRSNKHSGAKLINVNSSDSNMAREDILAKNLQELVQNPLKCPLCGIEFINRITVVNHIRSVHRLYKCNICDITIHGTTSANYHKVTKHTEPSFECGKCATKFFFQKSYDSHIRNCDGARRHTTSPEQNQTKSDHLDTQMEIEVEETKLIPSESSAKSISNCPETGLDIGSSNDCSRPDQKPNNANSRKEAPVNLAKGADAFKCSYCEQNYFDYAAVTEHVLFNHVPTPCDFCGITLDNLVRLIYHKRKFHTESKYNCQKCSMKCITKQIYDNHVQFCEKRKFACYFCGKWFLDLQPMERHVKQRCKASNGNGSVANDLPIQKCSDCGKKINGEKALAIHYSEVHQENKCDICGKIFFGQAKLKSHKLSYHSEPKFMCSSCGKNFRYKSRLNEHYPSCKLKKYACEICRRMFKTEKSLRKHKKYRHQVEANLSNTTRHKNTRLSNKKHSHSCNICGMVFPEKNQFDQHMRAKHSNKVLECTYCSKIFTNKQSFNQHEPICAKRKFSCDICGQKFKLQIGVKRHKIRVHSEETVKIENIKAMECNEKQRQCTMEETQRDEPLSDCGIESSAYTFKNSTVSQTILKHPDDSQHDVRQVHTNSILPQNENITLKMEIKVEDTMLQEELYHLPNDN